jgi:hypothetical protein
MSRIRRISYAITPEGHRANAIKQAVGLRDKVLSIVDDANFSTSTARKITKKAAFSVVTRSLEETKGLPLSLREHLAMKELNKYISLAKHNKSDFFYASNTDLLPISHPRSTREHSMTASALRVARSRWFASDPRITDERAKAVLASAFESIPGSVEHLYYTSILLSLPQGMIPGDALIAASDGNSSASRSERARRQRRDSKGRFAYEGGGIRALIRRLSGDIFSISGRVVANAKNSRDVEVEFPDGKIAEINPAKGEYIKAVLPTPDGYSPNPVVPSVTDEVIDEKDLVFVDAPNGWNKDENYNELGDKVEKYVDSANEFAVYLSKQDDGSKEYKIVNAASDEEIAVVKTWADVQDKLEGNEDQLLNPKAKLPEKDDFFPYKDKQGPNAYEKLMAEKKDRENAIANREAELKKNAEDRVDALDRNVPEGWDINQKNNALMLRRQTEPADLENIYKQNNFVARVIEQGEISVKDVNGLLEEKMYENWASVEKDKDARATEYAQKAREEIKKFAAPYGYSEEDLNKIDSMSAEEISSFFLDEKLQPENFADALDDYMTSDMVDAPSERQKAKWKSFGEKLKLINDAGDFPGTNAPVAELPKQPQQPDAPVETTKGGFEYNYPDGAYKINQASEYDVQGRVDEESPDFTDDPVELAQKQDERDMLAALEQAVSPGEDGGDALGVGALPFNRGDEFVPAEAIFFALQEAGVDAPMELAKIYDKKLGNNSNEKALNDFRKKAEIVSGNIPELAESFKKVTEQNPDLELPTEAPKFDAEAVELIPLPPLLDGLSQKELDQFMETKDHTPYLPKNEEIEMPEGYNPLSQEPFAAWKEVTAENPDAILPEGFSDNPVYLAQEVPTNNLLKELRRSVEPGNEVPGAAVVAFPTDDGEDFVANVPGEAVRDALQLQGVDTNAELRKIAEEGLAGQVDEVFEVPELPTEDAPEGVIRLVVDGDVPLEKQIRDAIAAKSKVAFLYNDVERVVLPTEIFENPKNSNVNMRAIDANGDRKTFTLSKIENSKIGAPVAPIEITDKEIFDRRMAGESLQDLADALGIPREEVRAREAKYLRENPQESPLNEEQMKELENILGSDNFGVKDGYLFLRKEEGFGKYADEVSVYDYKKYDEEVANNKELATINNDGNIDWPTEEDFNNHSANINNILNVEKADEKNIVGDYKPAADQINKLQKGVAELDWLDDGIMFLKPDEGGPRAEAPIEIYDDNGLPEDGPFAKIDVDGNFEWKDKAAYDKYADRLKEIFDAGLEGIDDNQAIQEPQEIDNVPVEQEKLDDNKPAENKTYVEENPEVIKVNAFVEANAGRLAPTKARDVKRGDFLWNNFNKVYEEILDIQPAAFGRVRFLIKDPRNQKEYFRFFDRRSPIRNMRRLGTGEVSEGFKVAPEENKGDGPKRGRALRQPLEQRVEVVAGRDVGGFAYKEGFYKDKNGIVLKPGDKVRHGNPKKNEMYGEGVVLVRAGDQIDEAKKVGGIGRGGKVYKDYVWVQIPGEAGPRLWKARMIVKQEDNAGPAQDAPAVEDIANDRFAVPLMEPLGRKDKSKEKDLENQIRRAIDAGDEVSFNYNGKTRYVKPVKVWENPQNGNVNITAIENGEIKNFTIGKMDYIADAEGAGIERPQEEKFEPLGVVFELDNDNIKNGLEEIRKGIKKLNKGGRITTLKNAEAALDNFVGKLDVKDHRGMDITELDALLRRLGRTDRADDLVAAVEQLKNIVEPEKQRLQLDFERKMFDEINNPLEATVADAKTINAANVKEVIDEIVKRLPDNARDGAGYRLSIARRHLLLYLKNISTDDDLVYADPKSITEAISYLEGMPVDVSDIKKQLEDLKKSVKGYAKNNKKPFGKANMPFIDPIALQEQRVADGVNKFDLANAQNLKALVADDQFFVDNAFAASYKDELQNFFAQDGEVPLASLSVDARQALSQIISSEIRNLGAGSAEEKKVRANEYARMAMGLHEEKLAFNPNRDDLGPAGESLKDIDFNAVFNAGQNLANNRPTNLEINGQPTEFKIQRVGDGINANYNYRLIDKTSGQIFYFKRERTLETADSEYASNQLARALKIAGVPVVVKHNNDAQVLIMTNAGDSLDFEKDPNIAGNAGQDYLDVASRAAIADLIAFGILDAVILNTDRHTHNFLLGGIDRGNVDGNGREELQLLPIDHGFAQLFQNNYRVNDPLAYMTGGDGRDGGRINKAFAKDIGAIAYKELIDITVQQAIQAIERGDYLSDVKPANRQAIIDRLLTLKGIDVDKWKSNLAKKL